MADIDTGINISDLQIFKEENIKHEQGGGLRIQSDGSYIESDMESVDNFFLKFAKFKLSLSNLIQLSADPSKADFSADLNFKTASVRKPLFDENGKMVQNPVICPQCGKVVKQLQKNGYCSKACATLAKTKQATAKLSSTGERTLEKIRMIQRVLDLVDMCLDVITIFPELIVEHLRLPEEYREYVTLQIDITFLQMKKVINNLMILKNNMIIDLLKTINFGVLDDKLQVLFAPIQSIIQIAQGIQMALNVALQAALAMLQVGPSGIPPQSYGFFLTAKSVQQPMYASKLLIEVVPTLNKMLPIQNMMSNIDYEKIEKIIQKALPPLYEFEYFYDPAAFKVRYALSQENIPTVKKMQQFLEAICVMGCDTFPRYKRLKLSNVWFVLAIFTGWGPVSQKVFGDFIFHGPI